MPFNKLRGKTVRERSLFVIFSLMWLLFWTLSGESLPANPGKEREKSKNKNSSESRESLRMSQRDINNGKCLVKTYRVLKGDTFFGIARRFGISIDEIKKINNIKGDDLKAGMVLKLNNCTSARADGIKAVKGNFDDLDYRKKAAKEDNSDYKFFWPVKHIITYKRDRTDGVNSHGIIIIAPKDVSVIASMDGEVEKIGYMRGYKTYIILKHDSRFITVYSNLDSVCVKKGERVRKGDILGKTSSDGKIHFQIGKNGRPQDPLKYLQERG